MHCVLHCKTVTSIFTCGVIIGYILIITTPINIRRISKLPVTIWLPYDYSSTHTSFGLTYLFVCVSRFIFKCFGILGTLDPLLGSLSYHATCQLKVINYKLKRLNIQQQSAECKNMRSAPSIRDWVCFLKKY